MTVNYKAYSLLNYLVPTDGTTHGISANIVASNVATLIDWQQVSTQFQTPFVPQGVYIDATQSTTDVVLKISGFGLNIKCQAGTIQAYSYPALRQNQKISVTGQGQVNMVFVDYPVLPSTLYSPPTLAQLVTVTNDPLNVSVPQDAPGGVAYNVNIVSGGGGATYPVMASAYYEPLADTNVHNPTFVGAPDFFTAHNSSATSIVQIGKDTGTFSGAGDTTGVLFIFPGETLTLDYAPFASGKLYYVANAIDADGYISFNFYTK